MFLCYLCGAEGILYALDFVLFLEFGMKEAAAATALICLILWLLGVPRGKGRFLSWPLAAAGIFLLWRLLPDAPQQVRLFYETARKDIWALAKTDMTATVILFAAVCSLFLYLLTYVLRMTGLFLIISIPMVFLGPLLGQKLDLTEICLLSVFHIGTWILGAGCHRRDPGIQGELAGALLTLGIFLALIPALERGGAHGVEQLMKLSAGIQEQIHQMVTQAAGQEKEGTVNRGNQSPTGQERLEVLSSEMPQETLYLKNFTGSRYMGDFWEKADESGFLLQQGISENVDAAEDTKFTWYPGEKQPQLSLKTRDLTAEDGPLLAVGSSLPGEEEGIYQQYAAEHYMEVPVSSLPQMMQLCGENPLTESESATDHVLRLIHERMVYSRTPGQVPLGRDTIEYYLFEKGEGYCQHFACAAALMYRIYGIPSRYASGYIARPSEFTQDGDNFHAVLTDENAHAWVEIYLPGQGWAVVEATPPGSVVANPVNPLSDLRKTAQEEMPQVQTASPTPEQKPEREPSGEEEEQRPAGSPQFHLTKVLRLFLPSALAVILLTALGWKLLAVRRIRVRKRYPRWRADRLYVRMTQALHFGGFLTEYDGQEKEFGSALCEAIPIISPQQALMGQQAALQAAYGAQRLSKKQRRCVWELYRETCRFLAQQQKGARKFVFCYIRAFW